MRKFKMKKSSPENSLSNEIESDSAHHNNLDYEVS